MRISGCLLLLCAASVHAADRPGQISAGLAYRGGEIVVRYAMTIEPPLKDSQILLLGTGVHTMHDRMHRFVVDKASGTYFGYDLRVEPMEGGKSYRAIIEPLSIGPEGEHWIPRDMALRAAPLPSIPPPQIVQSGDTIALDLLISPDGRQRVVDYLEFDRNTPTGLAGEPRDFTLDDGPLNIQFHQPLRFAINGRTLDAHTKMSVGRGGTVWLAFPNRGRFILSLAPHERFEKAGAIRGPVLAFQSGGEQYELQTWGPIVAGGPWNLYVFHDPSYSTEAGTVAGGTGRLETLLQQR